MAGMDDDVQVQADEADEEDFMEGNGDVATAVLNTLG